MIQVSKGIKKNRLDRWWQLHALGNLILRQLRSFSLVLATGGSAKAAIELLVETYGVRTDKIIFANMITCPEGIQAMKNAYPDVKIVTACIDQRLNEEKYIVPGLGDYGDRFFNTL